MKFKTSDNFEIQYEEANSSLGKNVVFIHGNLASRNWWLPSLELLQDSSGSHTEKLIAADWRGYGESKGLEAKSDIDFEKFANDYIELIEDKGMTNVNLVGHSTGGMIAMLAILKKPELFASLVLLDSVGPTGLELPLPKEQVLAHFEKMSTDRDYCNMVLAATIDGCDVTSSQFKALADQAFQCDKVMWKGVIEILAEEVNFSEKMDQIQLPTLVLHGEKDMTLPVEGSEQIDKMLPNSEFKLLEGQGHSCNMENPPRFVELLKDFWC